MLYSRDLQEQAVVAVWASCDNWLSRITFRFLAVWAGVTVVLSIVIERFFQRAGLTQEQLQLSLVKVEFEVMGRHPSEYVSQASRDMGRYLCVRGWEGEV